MEIRPVGVNGALCVLGDAVSERVSGEVAALARGVEAARWPGVVEAVPGYVSVLVRFDPLLTDFDAVAARLFALEPSNAPERAAGRTVDIPVCYGGGFGPDLESVAKHAGLTEAEVVELHSLRRYPIYAIGFLPSFPYLGGLDARLHTPRLATPRTRIPAGSVGIGGQQTGVYSMESPGGWQIIGRTPLRLFAPGQSPLYRVGDAIRFVPISPEDYREMEARACR